MELILALMNLPHVMLPGGSANLLILLRWIHLIAGITWVGLLYFFLLVNTPVLQEMDPNVRPRVVVTLMPRALWWFRWAAVVTVLAGIWYWMTIVSADAHNAQTSGGLAIGTFFMIWTAAFIMEMALLMGPAESLRNGPVLGTIMSNLVIAASMLYLSCIYNGLECNWMCA